MKNGFLLSVSSAVLLFGAAANAQEGWSATSTVGAPTGRNAHSGIWTGREFIVWGGGTGSSTETGGRYDPITDSWTATTTVSVASRRMGHTAIWTGSEMIVWGDFTASR